MRNEESFMGTGMFRENRGRGNRAEFNWKGSFYAGLEGRLGFKPRIKNIPGKETYAGTQEGKWKTCMHSLVWLKPKFGKRKSGWKCPLGGRLKVNTVFVHFSLSKVVSPDSRR